MANLLTENFTGTDGNPWSGTNWINLSGATIQSNRGRLLTAGSAFASASADVNTTLLTGYLGSFDFYGEAIINDASNTGYVTFYLASPTGGNDYQVTINVDDGASSIEKRASYSGLGVSDTGTVSGTALADGGTLKCRIVKNLGDIKCYFWTDGSQPGTATVEMVDTTPYLGDALTISITNGNETTALQADWDNVTIDSVAGVMTISSEVGTSLGSSNAQTLPPGASSGDLILVWVGVDNNDATAVSASTGWTVLEDKVCTGNLERSAIIARVLDGSGSDSLSVSGSSQDYVVQQVRIPSGYHGVSSGSISTDIKFNNNDNGGSTSTAHNPSSLNMGSSKDWLAFASLTLDSTTASVISAVPTNYAQLTNRQSAANTTSTVQAVAFRQLSAASTEDPGAFANSSRRGIARTVAVPPASGSSPQTITAQIASLDLQGVAGTVSVGAVTVTAQVATLSLSGVPNTASTTGGAQEIVAQIASLDLQGVAGTVSVGAVTVTAQVATLDLEGLAGTVSVGGVTVTAQVALLDLVAVPGSVSVGAVAVTAQVGLLDLVAVPGSVSVGAVSVTAQVATLALSGVQGVVTAGGLVIAQPAMLDLQGVPGVVTVGEVVVTAQIALLDLVALAGTVTPGAVVTPAQPATLALSGVPGTVTPGVVAVAAQVALLQLLGIAGIASNQGPVNGGHASASNAPRGTGLVVLAARGGGGIVNTQPDTGTVEDAPT